MFPIRVYARELSYIIAIDLVISLIWSFILCSGYCPGEWYFGKTFILSSLNICHWDTMGLDYFGPMHSNTVILSFILLFIQQIFIEKQKHNYTDSFS